VAFLAQLWNSAWDIWAYHNTNNTRQLELLWHRVSQEFNQGTGQLPHTEWHWFEGTLAALLQ